jgi:hypothetical protein
MMNPDRFLAGVLEAVDDAAFRLSHTPGQEEWLQGFAERVGAQWRQVFEPFMSAEDVDGMVADVVQRVRKRRDEIEAAGVGRA